MILDPQDPTYQSDGTEAMIRATFGKPVRTYRVDTYLVLVWHKNLLDGLGCGDVYGLGTGTASATGPRCS